MKNQTPAQLMYVINSGLDTLLKGTSFEDYEYHDFEYAEDLIEHLMEQIHQEEVIYYSKAIEYLSKNDASLKDSLSIACELGYKTEDLNSELLATLLKQKDLEEELNDLVSEIEDVYNQQ